MLQFSRNPELGRCAFADRYQYRLELDWRRVPAPPDFDRMMSDYRTRLQAEGMTDLQEFELLGWQGFHGTSAQNMTTSRFGRYFTPQKCLLELVFIWPGQREPSLENQVLASIRDCPATAEGFSRWRAFGMDILVPEAFRLTECTVWPAHACMEFRDERGRRRQGFSRRGLTDTWLRGTVADWLGAQVPHGSRIRRQTASDSGRHRIHSIGAVRPRKGLLPGGVLTDWTAWICPSDGRLYCTTSEQPAQSDDPNSKGRLRCCEEWGGIHG